MTLAMNRTTSVELVNGEFEADAVVESRHDAADGVVVLTLREAGGHQLPDWQPGAHVDLVLADGLTRQYSLCGDPADQHLWRLGVLREPDGPGGSALVHDALHPGAPIRVRGPRNHFPLRESPRYLFVAGGIGITPILTMIAAADLAGADWELVYGGRRRSSMAFLDELARYGDRVTIAPAGRDRSPRPRHPARRAPRGHARLLLRPGAPAGGGRGALRAAGRPGRCASSGSPRRPLTEPVLAGTFEVYLQQSEQTLTVPPDRSVLDVVEEAGANVMSSCSEGTCGTCETSVLDGEPDHRDSVLTAEEQAANDCMMICVSRSRCPLLVLDL